MVKSEGPALFAALGCGHRCRHRPQIRTSSHSASSQPLTFNSTSNRGRCGRFSSSCGACVRACGALAVKFDGAVQRRVRAVQATADRPHQARRQVLRSHHIGRSNRASCRPLCMYCQERIVNVPSELVSPLYTGAPSYMNMPTTTPRTDALLCTGIDAWSVPCSVGRRYPLG